MAVKEEKSLLKLRHRNSRTEAWYHLGPANGAWKLRRLDLNENQVDQRATLNGQSGNLSSIEVQFEVLGQFNYDAIRKRGVQLKSGGIPIDKEEHFQTWCETARFLDNPASSPPPISPGQAAPPRGPLPPSGDPRPPRNTIPQTKLRHLYDMLGDFSAKECHLALAKEAARVPKRLGERFEASVAHFSQYQNEHEPFVPDATKRTPLPDWQQIREIGGTNDLTAFLAHQLNGIGAVEGGSHADLSFQYVEREVIAARTTNRAIYEDGTSAQRGPQLDWLLMNAQDRTPIMAEIKIKDDKNLFSAFIQALMYASEFSTSSQRARLCRHYPTQWGNWQQATVDIYLIVSNFNDRSQVNRDIFEATKELCEHFVPLCSHVRRIACLNAMLNAEGRLTFSCLFRF